jgi:hypothetical protein
MRLSPATPITATAATETRSSSKDYAREQGDAVNKRAGMSMDRNGLARRSRLEPLTLWLTGSPQDKAAKHLPSMCEHLDYSDLGLALPSMRWRLF